MEIAIMVILSVVVITAAYNLTRVATELEDGE